MQKTTPPWQHLLLLCVSLLWANGATAFSAMVSPPRFELVAKPGQTLREVLEISHVDATPGSYSFATADWSMDANAVVTFTDALSTDSCRSWVAIERRKMTLPANGRAKFRIEISVPATAVARECRFALLVQGDDQVAQSPNLPMPIAGRIGIIFYVAVAGAKPALTFAPQGVARFENVNTPMLSVSNAGNAHGRLAGVLTGTDASGKRFEFVPEAVPILAGETRAVKLAPNLLGGAAGSPTLPIRVSGQLEWGDTRSAIDHEFKATP